MKGVRSFLGHVIFYRRFNKDFSNISTPLCALFEKNATFDFNDDCLISFAYLKEKLIATLIIIPPHWEPPFELMYDVSDFTVGAVHGLIHDKIFHVMYYVSRSLYESQRNYITIEK